MSVSLEALAREFGLESLLYFDAELTGPLRTAPEREPGEGGCPAINPRHRTPWWNRWWVAMDRRHRRWAARRRFLMANAEWLGITKPHDVLPMPLWVSA